MWKIEFASRNTFIKNADNKITYSDFTNTFCSLSQQLVNVKKDDLVFVDLKDPYFFISSVFAILQKKAIPCLINHYFNHNQISDLLKKNKYQWIISDQLTLSKDISQLLKDHNVKEISLDLTKVESVEVPDIHFHQSIIFYTSGSVSPKACVLTLENLFFNALGSYENISFEEGETWGLCLPTFHVGGFSIFIRALLKLGTVKIIDKNKNLLEEIQDIEYISLVSTQFLRLLNDIKHPPLRLKTILLGGSTMPVSSLKKATQLRLPVKKSYGMTEMGSQITATTFLEEGDSDASGFLLSYRELSILDREICVKGDCLFQGYLENNNIVSSLDDDGWFHTKDYGFIDLDGQVHVEGRLDRIFQTGGENISPEFIEKTLLSISECVRCKVVPQKDQEYGQVAIAYIEIQSGTLESFEEKARNLLKGFYLPKQFIDYSELPTTNWKS